MVTIRIPGSPPLPNASSKAGSWHARAKSRRQWRETAEWATRAVHGADAAITACDIHVEHVLPDRRRRDLDGLAAAIKPLLDGMVDAGLMVDDSTAVVRSITHVATVVRGTRETVITVTAVEDAP